MPWIRLVDQEAGAGEERDLRNVVRHEGVRLIQHLRAPGVVQLRLSPDEQRWTCWLQYSMSFWSPPQP